MSAADRNKIIIAGGVALLAIIVIVFFLRGRGGRQRAAGAGGFGAAQQVAAGGAEQPGGAVAPGENVPAAPGGAAPGAPSAPGAPGAAEGAAAAGPAVSPYVGQVRMGTGPEERSRPDPFLTFEAPPQPISPEMLANLPPVILQAGGLRPPGMPEAAGPLGRRRVAGLLFDDGAWAILEQDGRTFIVKPGDMVDGSRVTAVGPDSIFVTDAQGKRWRVALRSLSPGGAAAAAISIPGMPAAPPAEE